jgi:CubicO group peptidase (beta-lactamase class C family)
MANLDSLAQLIEAQMAERQIPGVAVGLFHQGEEWRTGFGVTHVEHPRPVDGETLFQIGSVSKTFTATLLVMLAEAGQLDLDAPVRSYLPDFRVADEEASAQVTVAQLLYHVGGWEGDLFADTGAGEDALTRYVALMAEQPQISPYGRYFSYNNSAFSLAGHLVEQVTSQPFAQVMQERLFHPLGLSRTFYRPEDVMLHNFAVGHTVTDEKPTVAAPWSLTRAVEPAGSVTTHVGDLLTYARFHLDGGVTQEGFRLLPEAAILDMQRPRVATGQFQESVGLSWFLHEVDGMKLVSHGGATNGQMAHLILIPAERLALGIVTNGANGGLLNQAVRKWLLRDYLGLALAEATPLPDDGARLAEFCGRYSRGMMDLELTLEGDALSAKIQYKTGFPRQDSPMPDVPPIPLSLTDRGTLMAQGGRYDRAEGVFHRHPDGTIGWLLFGGRLHRKD